MNPADEPASSHPPTSASQQIELERSKIGHDIHDLLLPLIFAASANLSPLIESVEADGSLSRSDRERLKQAQQWLQEALGVGRNLLTQIYPPELEQLPWLAAAKDVARRICENRCEVIWTVDAKSPVCDPKWDREIAGAAYRIVVESLLNATRHGEAETAAIRCNVDSIVIVDDGNGFDPTAVDKNRFGIRSMKGRAMLVGKQVDVASQPGGPTTVTLSL